MGKICKIWTTEMRGKIVIKKKKMSYIMVSIKYNTFYLFISIYNLNQAPSARTTLGNSLTFSPSMEERFMCDKVIRTEGTHS